MADRLARHFPDVFLGTISHPVNPGKDLVRIDLANMRRDASVGTAFSWLLDDWRMPWWTCCVGEVGLVPASRSSYDDTTDHIFGQADK